MTSQPNPAPPRASPGGTLERVLALVRYLRVHCPWDARQTAVSLVPHLLEEAHEVAEAIRAGADADERCAELGDLLLNVAYQIVIAEEDGDFDADAVADALERKMVRRHPHVDWAGHPLGEGIVPAGDAAPDAGGARDREARKVAGRDLEARPGDTRDWELHKAGERAAAASALDGIAAGLDPLARANRVQERVAAVGFDWDDLDGPAVKVAEELGEARAALERRDAEDANDERAEEELGDLLFAVVNLCRRAGVHPGNALARANAKFERRYRHLEERLAARGARPTDLSLAELDAVWDEVKRAER